MVAGIVAGDGKTEKAQIGFYGFSRRTRRRQRAARGGGGSPQVGESTPVGGRAGRWLGGSPAVVRPRDPREERERDFRGEREREEERGLVEHGHVAQPYRAV
ncbi:hypothetical protein PanWU01x14_009840 [Parasponia andersonii]|uniref:Uncharacterized protein n=1 Tax=Parasponia andersonii TaxID=3476 RepID=A0A2P5E2H8_PARAD|nr:hypothetical protein PanWU01x14_009840 [Parasponia andersonii]